MMCSLSINLIVDWRRTTWSRGVVCPNTMTTRNDRQVDCSRFCRRLWIPNNAIAAELVSPCTNTLLLSCSLYACTVANWQYWPVKKQQRHSSPYACEKWYPKHIHQASLPLLAQRILRHGWVHLTAILRNHEENTMTLHTWQARLFVQVLVTSSQRTSKSSRYQPRVTMVASSKPQCWTPV